jgi:Seven in absentia protein family
MQNNESSNHDPTAPVSSTQISNPSITINNPDGTQVVIPFPPAIAAGNDVVDGRVHPQGTQVTQPQIQFMTHGQLQQQQQRHHVQVNYSINRPNTVGGTVAIAPLAPQPVTRSAATAPIDIDVEGEENKDDSDWQRFKCSICYEFMNEPSSCGSCSSRYCRLCLERCRRHDLNVIRRQTIARTANGLQQQQQQQQEELPKCPTCRVPYNIVVRDEALQQEMLESGPQVPCRYDGCMEVLRLPNRANHERTCSHATVHCRFAPYGCTWTGKRKDVSDHESSGDCSLTNISTFVEEFRKLKADHSSRIQITSHQASTAVRSNAIQQQNLLRHQLKSIFDLFSVLHFVYLVICAAPFVRRTPNTWSSFLAPVDRVAGVTNILIFSPTLLISTVTASHGVSSFLMLMDKLPNSIFKFLHNNHANGYSFWNRETEGLVEDCVLGSCAGLMGAMLVVINFLDTKSSLAWQGFKIKHLGNPPIVGDLLAVASFTQVLVLLEFFRAGSKAFLLWCCLASCTIVFPSTVWITSNRLVQRHLPSDIGPRCMPQLEFGLRYGLLATLFGIGPCMDAIAAFFLLPRRGCLTLPSPVRSGSHCFLDQVPGSFCWAYIGFRLATPAALRLPVLQTWLGDEWPPSDVSHDLYARKIIELFLPSLMCTLLLLGINIFFYCLTKIGIRMAELIILKTNAASARGQALSEQPIEYTGIGVLNFAFWAWTMIVIAHF